MLEPRPNATELGAYAEVPEAALAPGTAASFARTEKYTLPARPNDAALGPANASTAAAVEAISAGAFVRTSGTNFLLNDQVRYFAGSNDYFLVLR